MFPWRIQRAKTEPYFIIEKTFPWEIHRTETKLPNLTFLLVAINTFVFLLIYYSPNKEAIYYSYGMKWNLDFYITWLTSVFIHVSWWHLTVNMFFLFVFGSLVEDVLPRYKYLLIYIVGILIAAFIDGLAIIIFAKDSVIITGASGAVAALIGVVMLRFKRSQVTWYVLGVLWPLIFLLLIIFSLNSANLGLTMIAVFYTIFAISLSFIKAINEEMRFRQSLLGFWPVFTITAYETGLVYVIFLFTPGFAQIISGNYGGVAYLASIGSLLGGYVIAKRLNLEQEAENEYSTDTADRLLRLGDSEEAAQSYEKLIDKNYKNPEFLYKTAKSLAFEGEIEKSASYFIKSIIFFSKSGQKENASKAYDDLRKLLKGHSFNVKTEYKLASFAQTQNKFLDAIEHYQKIIDSFSDTKEAEFAILGIAQVYKKMGDTTKAEQILTEYSKRYPNSQLANFG